MVSHASYNKFMILWKSKLTVNANLNFNVWLLPLAHLHGAPYSKVNIWCCYENTGQFYQCWASRGEQIYNVPIHNMKCQQYHHWQYTDASGHTQTRAMTFIELCMCSHRSVPVDFSKVFRIQGLSLKQVWRNALVLISIITFFSKHTEGNRNKTTTKNVIIVEKCNLNGIWK